MDWQLPIALGIVLLACSYLAAQLWRSLVGSKSCGTSCSCAGSSPTPGKKDQSIIVPVQELTLRSRPGR